MRKLVLRNFWSYFAQIIEFFIWEHRKHIFLALAGLKEWDFTAIF